MREEIAVTGIVLYTSDLKEYDKRLVILTKERGKITVFANGARRAASLIRAASQSYVMGKFSITANRDSYTLQSAEVQEYFNEISKDMEKLCYAAYFAEMMSYYTREGDYCRDNLNLLYITLKALVAENVPLKLIRYIYEVKLMSIEGQGIHSFSCVRCNTKEKLQYFNAQAGGLLCEKCAGELKVEKQVSNTLVYTLQYILSTPISKLYSFNLTDEALLELSQIVDEFRTKYIDKTFNSMDILESLT